MTPVPIVIPDSDLTSGRETGRVPLTAGHSGFFHPSAQGYGPEELAFVLTPTQTMTPGAAWQWAPFCVGAINLWEMLGPAGSLYRLAWDAASGNLEVPSDLSDAINSALERVDAHGPGERPGWAAQLARDVSDATD